MFGFKVHPKNENTENDARLEVFTAVTMKNAIFWDVTPYGSYKHHTA
jgi:hypothetical protein